MADYVVSWSGKAGEGERKLRSAISASSWVNQFRDDGADKITITRDGTQIEEHQLPGLMKLEAFQSSRPK